MRKSPSLKTSLSLLSNVLVSSFASSSFSFIWSIVLNLSFWTSTLPASYDRSTLSNGLLRIFLMSYSSTLASEFYVSKKFTNSLSCCWFISCFSIDTQEGFDFAVGELDPIEYSFLNKFYFLTPTKDTLFFD